jgi:hypothetical protein
MSLRPEVNGSVGEGAGNRTLIYGLKDHAVYVHQFLQEALPYSSRPLKLAIRPTGHTE